MAREGQGMEREEKDGDQEEKKERVECWRVRIFGEGELGGEEPGVPQTCPRALIPKSEP